MYISTSGSFTWGLMSAMIIFWRLLTDESPRLRDALRHTIYGKSGVFDAERFIDVMQAFENFITAAKSGGGENLNGNMAELGLLPGRTPYLLPGVQSVALVPQTQQPVQTRAALPFLLSDKGDFFPEFLLDEGHYTNVEAPFMSITRLLRALMQLQGNNL
ncbi:hypothetical protein L6164_016574 [Bauhinia variegata]|uniref:Uncharacterized protein n=1 Tax=Bauhinia variegata TaxID=167791 RepID=A0ACB9NP14_BAUVA|nr:hypothetical protein L6164_016574 [Bauhinia variegata]